MIDFVIVKYIHFLGVFTVVGALTAELVLVRHEMTRKEIQLLSRIDMFYGIGTVVVMSAGFALWFAIGKPPSFYSNNWIFIAKLILFSIVGILSILPTVFFLKNRKGQEEDVVVIPSKIRILIVLECILLVLIPLCAVLMANGIGAF